MIDDTRRPIAVAVASDGSPAALRFAVQEALRTGCGLHLVHVAELAGTTDQDAADRRAHGVLFVAAVHARAVLAGRGLVTRSVVHGPVPEAVVAASADARSIVVGRRRAPAQGGGTTRAISAAIACRSPLPVVSVPGDWQAHDRGRVTVGLDLPELNRTVLEEAWHLAAAHRAALQVVHTSLAEVDSILTDLRSAGDESVPVQLDLQLHRDRMERALLEASRSSDLVVVGRDACADPHGSRLGPLALAVLRGSDAPVLLVSPGGSRRLGVRAGAGPRARTALVC
jgi:hypothetical protein